MDQEEHFFLRSSALPLTSYVSWIRKATNTLYLNTHTYTHTQNWEVDGIHSFVYLFNKLLLTAYLC